VTLPRSDLPEPLTLSLVWDNAEKEIARSVDKGVGKQ
jgi:hypothetical protein